MWKNYTNGVLGIVLVIVAFLDLSETTLVWTLGVLGGAIAILGFWNASTSSRQIMKNA